MERGDNEAGRKEAKDEDLLEVAHRAKAAATNVPKLKRP